MTRGSRFQKNIPPNMVGPNKPEQPVSPKKTPATSGMGHLDAPLLLLVPITVSTNRLFLQFMKAYLENQNQALPPTPI